MYRHVSADVARATSSRSRRHAATRYAPGPIGIRRPEVRRDDLADRVVDDEPIRPESHERQASEPVEDVLRRRLGEHRGEQRERRPANDRRGVQRLPGRRVEMPQVQLRQLVDDRRDGRRVRVDRRVRVHRRRRQTQRQRVAANDPVDPFELAAAHALVAQQLQRVVAGEVREQDGPEEAAELERPGVDRRVATGEDDPDVVVEGRHERLAQPRIERPDELVPIEREDDALPERREPRDRAVDVRQHLAGGRGKPAEEAADRRLDRATVQQHGDGPTLARLDQERLEQPRLADAADAVDEHDQRLDVVEHLAEDEPLGVAPDETRGPPLGHQSRRLTPRRRTGSRGRGRSRSPPSGPRVCVAATSRAPR